MKFKITIKLLPDKCDRNPPHSSLLHLHRNYKMGNVYAKTQCVKVNMCFRGKTVFSLRWTWAKMVPDFFHSETVWILLSCGASSEPEPEPPYTVRGAPQTWEKVSRRAQLKQHTHTHTTQGSIFLLNPRHTHTHTHTHTHSQSEECVTLNHSEGKHKNKTASSFSTMSV